MFSSGAVRLKLFRALTKSPVCECKEGYRALTTAVVGAGPVGAGWRRGEPACAAAAAFGAGVGHGVGGLGDAHAVGLCVRTVSALCSSGWTSSGCTEGRRRALVAKPNTLESRP